MSHILVALRPTTMMLLLFTLLLGGIYPALSTLLVQGLFPEQSQASLIRGKDNTILGSRLIGQSFSQPQYFWGRLSAVTYNAAASSGTNLGVANPALLAAAQSRLDALKAADSSNTKPVPVDLITASGSGLDPEISPAAADYQIARIARLRNRPESEIRALVQSFTSDRQLGFLGEKRVNVLKLNLALDGKL